MSISVSEKSVRTNKHKIQRNGGWQGCTRDHTEVPNCPPSSPWVGGWIHGSIQLSRSKYIDKQIRMKEGYAWDQ